MRCLVLAPLVVHRTWAAQEKLARLVAAGPGDAATTAMDLVKQLCPCPFGDEAKKGLFSTSTRGDDSDSDKGAGETSMANRAKGWMEMAAAPVKAFQAKRTEDAAREQRKDKLKAGTVMKLVTKDDRGASYLKGDVAPVDAWGHEFVLEQDGSSILIWSLGRDGSEGGGSAHQKGKGEMPWQPHDAS